MWRTLVRFWWQSVSIGTAVTILQQCVAGLHHLHTLGIIHRDFRAANILIAGTVPLHVVVADFGVSHQLRVYAEAAAALGTAAGAGTHVRTVLSGNDGLFPVAWVAPEVLSGSLREGVTATPASDVYMLGGLMFEVLTCGLTPYYWMSDMRLVAQRRRHVAGETFRPSGLPVDVVGLRGLSVVTAGVVDGVDMPWRVSGGGGDVYGSGVGGLVALMEECMDVDADKRPSLSDVQTRLKGLVASVRA